MSQALTNQLTTEYQALFNTCEIDPARSKEIDHNIDTMLAHRAIYEAIANEINVPWYFVSIIHCMEGSLDFNKHLHNGDPLTARTVQVPAGRPVTGNPPFSFHDSAVDALQFDHLVPLVDTSVPGMLFAFENYNGFGSRAHGINSPYLWSFSNHYTKGKFIRDHVFDPEAVSKQVGAAVLLRRIMERQLTLGESDVISQIRKVGEQVLYNPTHFSGQAQELQKLLNAAGLPLKPDGFAGDHTSEAYQHISGRYLNGDKRRV